MLTKIQDIMIPVKSGLSLNAMLKDAFAYWQEYKVNGAPVVDKDNKVVGMVTRDALLQKDIVQLSLSKSLKDFMDSDFGILNPEDLVARTWNLSHLCFAVLDKEQKLLGLVTKLGLLEAYCANVEYKLKEMDAIINSAYNGIVAIDADGVITLFNPAAEKFSRRSRECAIGKKLTEVVVPSGLLEVLNTGQTQHGIEYQVGKRKYISNRAPIIQEGKVTGAVGVFQDISEIEFISKELSSVRQLNQELQTLVDSSYDGILVTDVQGRVLRVNQAFERITGIAQERALKLTEKEMFAHSIGEEVLKKQEIVSSVEYRLPAGNCLLITGNPVFDEEGRVVRIVINVRDITELNRLKKELERTRELSLRYHLELAELRAQLFHQEGIIVSSPSMNKVMELAVRVSSVDSTVMILGESGAGKEVVAKIIHINSQRKNGPFIKVNCGAIPENLLESELFGYEPGAFTGASRAGKPGMFELADKGTLFLDEIGDLPLGLQAKLLRVIQDKELIRIGGVKARKIDVRILAATNKNLENKIKCGQFREDLYFRLNVVPIQIPPLRERREDIVPLIQTFREKFYKQYGLRKKFTGEAVDAMLKYNWPGNVRELENIVERLYVTVPGDLIELEHIPAYMREQVRNERMVSVSGILPLKRAVLELESQLIHQAMEKYGSTYKAAKVLKVDQSTVVRKLQRLHQSKVS